MNPIPNPTKKKKVTSWETENDWDSGEQISESNMLVDVNEDNDITYIPKYNYSFAPSTSEVENNLPLLRPFSRGSTCHFEEVPDNEMIPETEPSDCFNPNEFFSNYIESRYFGNSVKNHGDEFLKNDFSINNFIQDINEKLSFYETHKSSTLIRSVPVKELMVNSSRTYQESTSSESDDSELSSTELQDEQNSGVQEEQINLKHLKVEEEKPEFENSFSSDSALRKAKYFDSFDGKLVVINKGCEISLHGVVTLSVLYGEVEILGYRATKSLKELKLYSPRGTSLLSLKNVVQEKHSECDLTEVLSNYKDVFKNYRPDLDCSILLCKKLIEPFILFIERHISQQILPKRESYIPPFSFDPRGDWNIINTSEEWENLAETVTPNTKMIFCGGKGVGKSTLFRYTINKVLQKYKKVHIIDLDPGQSEFTIPGCISFLTVSEPLLGPNYTHLQDTDMSVTCGIAVNNYKNYLLAVQCLIQEFKKQNDTPVLINYMGYVAEMGLHIAAAVISYIHPTDVIQIQSANPKKNFITDLTPRCVKNLSRYFVNGIPCYVKIEREAARIVDQETSAIDAFLQNLEYKLVKIESLSDQRTGIWSLQARQMREMCVLAYFGKMVSFDNLSIFNMDLPIYRFQYPSVKVISFDNGDDSWSIARGSLLYLASELKENCYRCYGWGIGRVQDFENNTLLVLSPVDFEIIEQKVKVLIIIKTVQLPPSIYMTPDGVTGLMPFVSVTKGDSNNFAKAPKRAYMPVKT